MKDNLKRFFLKLYFIFLRLFKIKNNKIVITSYYGKGYGDNSKYICKELLSRKNNYDIVWLVNDMKEEFPDGIRKVKFKSFRSFYELATAKIWIDNCRKHDYILKRKEQYYIQTWHSCLRLKKIEADAIDLLPKEYIRNAKADSKKMDLLTVGCGFSEEMYNRVFWYNGKKLRCGTPRCDLFFNENDKKYVKDTFLKQYNINADTKIILYAPTFKKSSNEIIIDYEKIIQKLLKYDKYIFLVRFHPISKNTIKSSKNVINVTDYPDIQELIATCDFMITDYSGCCFDAMFASKPCILFTPDFKDYIKKERSLVFDFNELPFDRVYNFDELVFTIGNFNYKNYINKVNKFMNKINNFEEGNASKKIANIIDERMNYNE